MKVIWAFIIASLVVVALWRFTGVTFPMRQLKILIVLLSTTAAAMLLVKGVLRGFSRTGGWRPATPLLIWAASLLSLSAWALWGEALAMGVYAVLALAASVLTQRQREQQTL
jgi:hypothetical protein